MFRSVYRQMLLAGLILLLTALRLWDPLWIEGLRLRGFDLVQQLSPLRVEVADSAVIVLDIDEESIEQFGQWPWPRSIIAKLLDACAEAGAAAIGLDMLFAEQDRTSPPVLAQQSSLPAELRESLATLPSHERLLAHAMGKIPTVLAWTATEHPTADSPATAVSAVLGDATQLQLVTFPGVSGNLPTLEEAAAGRGLITVTQEPDGLIRRIPAISRVGSSYWPALGLELLRVGIGGSSFILEAGPTGLEGAMVQTAQGALKMPVSGDGRLWLRNTPFDSGRYISIADVLAPDGVDRFRERLEDRLVLVGSTFSGLGDRFQLPFSRYLPGVEIHAQAIDALLQGQVPSRPPWILAAELFGMGLTALLASMLAARLTPAAALAGLGLLLSLHWGMAWIAFRQHLWLTDATLPTMALLAAGGVSLLVGYLRTARERHWIRHAFSRYLPEPVVDKLSQHHDQLRLRGETRELTLMFSDVRGFTTLSEGMPPEQLGQLMNRLFTGLTAVIQTHGGTIDKYVGDCIMAFWNAPLSDQEHALHACQAALAMQSKLPELNRELHNEGLLQRDQLIRIGVGIHTGTASVGNFGSRQRFAYTALGDTVNLASRLEGLCKTHHVGIVISAETRAQVRGVRTKLLGEVPVRGRNAPVMVYSLEEFTT